MQWIIPSVVLFFYKNCCCSGIYYHGCSCLGKSKRRRGELDDDIELQFSVVGLNDLIDGKFFFYKERFVGG